MSSSAVCLPITEFQNPERRFKLSLSHRPPAMRVLCSGMDKTLVALEKRHSLLVVELLRPDISHRFDVFLSVFDSPDPASSSSFTRTHKSRVHEGSISSRSFGFRDGTFVICGRSLYKMPYITWKLCKNL